MQWNQLIDQVSTLEVKTLEVAALDSSESSKAAVTGVEYDSRRVVQGSVFVAMRGGTSDGNRFIDTAIAQGSSGIITDDTSSFRELSAKRIPAALVSHGRTALAQASAAFFGHPERIMRSV